MLETNLHQEQMKDTRYNPPPQTTPLYHIHINECNPTDNIAYTQSTIQTQHHKTHIYDNNERHLITIHEPTQRFSLDQFHLALNRLHNLEPPTQPFETKLAWPYQIYRFKTPQNDPLKLSQYTLPNATFQHLTNSFQITHSYFSSSVPCSTTLKHFYSPFPKDVVFGLVGKMFQQNGMSMGTPTHLQKNEAQQTLHWARLAAKNNSKFVQY